MRGATWQSKNAMIWALVAVTTVAVVGGLGFVVHRSGLLGSAPADHVVVASGGHYVVLLSQIEVERGKPSGRKWDMRDDGPDLRYDIYWRGNRIFRSSVRNDTLLARWDPQEVGIDDLIKGVSAERSLKAARITAQRGETLEFRVIDADSIDDDEIGEWQVAVDDLRTGDQTWNAPAPGIRQVVCRVIPVDQGGR